MTAPPAPSVPRGPTSEPCDSPRDTLAGADVSTRVVTMTWIAGAAAVLCGTVLLVSLAITALPGRVSTHLALLLGAVMTGGLAAVAAAWMLRHGGRAADSHARAWRFTGCGLAAWSAGSWMWVGTLAGVLPPIAGRIGEGLYLASVVLMSAAVLQHPLLGERPARLRAIVDGSIMATSGALLVWFAAARQLYRRTGDLPGTVFAMVYPTVEIAVALLCLWMVTRAARRTADQRVGLLLAAAFGAFALGDTLALALRDSTGDRVPLLPELPFALGIALCVLATWASLGHATVEIWALDRRRLADGLGVAPAMAAVVAGFAVLADGVVRGRVDPAALLLLTVVVSMVLARQSLTLTDNRQLSSSLRATVSRLERQATHDALTDLPNRAGLTERIEAALAGSTAHHTYAALCFVDLDHLKSVNDSLGHSAGDELLEVLARRLATHAAAEVTRFGGDEFVVVARDLPTRAAAQDLGEEILHDAGRPTTVNGLVVRPSVSVGIAVAEPGVDAEELLRRADIALYRAKALGRRRTATYDVVRDADSRRRIDLEPELRRALEHDEFEVHYQPVVELATGRMTKVEALLRWRHPERGLLTPDAFLAEATAAGLLGSIGERTLMTACRDFSAPHARSVKVSVNLSTTELTDRRVVERVRRACATHGFTPDRLIIEITEDVVVDGTIRRTIDELCELGVALAIDDFGTGNSSLRQLGSYPADTLKVDKSFIDGLDTDVEAAMITRAILGLARNLGLRTIAEGVETEAQAELLRELGCDFAQGWLYSRAVPFAELERRDLAPDASGWFADGRRSDDGRTDDVLAPSSELSSRDG